MILAAVLVGCSPRPAPAVAPPPAPQVWVDAFASAPGDGTRSSPFKELPARVAAGTELHLASGLYRGPFELTGVRLVGHGQAVVYVEGEGTVVAGRDVALVDLSVQGGSTGVVVGGRWSLTNVHFSGHRKTGVEVPAGGELTVDRCAFEASVPDTVAIHVGGGAARVAGTTFRSSFRRAIDLEGGTVEVRGSAFEGPREAVHAEGATSTVRDTSVAGGRGPAFFAAGGSIVLEGVTVTGHDYALQTGVGTRAVVRGLTARRPLTAGVALVESTGTLERLDIEGSGASGALELLGGVVTVDGARIANAQSLGVFVRKGTVTLRRIEVNGVRAEGESQGDGLHLRAAQVDADDITVRDTEGSGVLVTARGRLTLGRLVSERSGYGALVVERGSEAVVREVVSSGARGPAVSLPDAASLKLGRLEVKGGADVPLWVECAQGASATVGQIVSAVTQPLSRCIERK